MTALVERPRSQEGNVAFRHHFVEALKDLTGNLPHPTVLEYGAGVTPFNATTPFSDLQMNQETVAYDPALPKNVLYSVPSSNSLITWTGDLPQAQPFDLAIFSFSLHHASKPPEKTIGELRSYDSKFAAVSDYDFTNATLAEFRERFVSDSEQRELQNVFGGDWQMCFDFHRRYGQEVYRQALEGSGFSVVRTEYGSGAAKNKFFMIGAAGK